MRKKIHRTYFLLAIVLFCFWPKTSLALEQEIEIPRRSKAFQNDNRNSFMVFSDSTYFFEYKVAEGYWRKYPYVFAGEMSFDFFSKNYRPIATENGSVYFVDRGIGQVYKLINDTLKRIDNSFHHKNQFSGNLFTYKDTIYCFGGYGLFTHKNMITFFDENTKKWSLLKPKMSSEKPQSRASSFFQVSGGQFYMASGVGLNNNMLRDVWQFSLTRKEWKYLGELDMNQQAFDTRFPPLNLKDLNINGRNLYELDIERNQLKSYELNVVRDLNFALKNKTGKYICLSRLASTKGRRKVSIVVSNEFLPEGKTTTLYFSKNKRMYNYSLSFWLLLLLVLGVVYFFKEKEGAKKRNKIAKKEMFQCIDECFYFNGLLLESNFNSLEESVLTHFLKAENYSLELAELHSIFDYENPTIDTIKKRRENFLQSIREKVTEKTSFTSEVFIASKSLKDKRVKVLTLNPILVR